MQTKVGLSGFFLLWLFHHSVEAQLNISFSDYFDQFYNNYYLLNPANNDSSHIVAAQVSNRTLTGLFKGVNKVYLDLDFRVLSKRGVQHFLGIQIVNSREGEFITKSRAVGRYSLRIQLSNRSSLSAGLAAGFVNYSFETSQSGVGGSDWVPDVSTGIWYLRKKISVGVSIQQLLNQKIQPVNQIFFLNNYYSITGRYIIPFTSFLKFHAHVYSKVQQGQKVHASCSPLFEIKEIADLGLGYSLHRGWSYVAGIKNRAIAKSAFSLHFSYFVGAGQGSVTDNAFEVLISYRYK